MGAILEVAPGENKPCLPRTDRNCRTEFATGILYSCRWPVRYEERSRDRKPTVCSHADTTAATIAVEHTKQSVFQLMMLYGVCSDDAGDSTFVSANPLTAKENCVQGVRMAF